jgi:uncharacterized protein with HEPN domain
MRPDVRDATWLMDMLKFARELVEFTSGVTREQYFRELMRRRAVERSSEILGEAAKRVSQEFRAAHLEIDWRAMAGLRDVLAHQYGGVDHVRLWEVATLQAPSLIATLESVLAPEPE